MQQAVSKSVCTRHASCALFGRMCLISWRHVLFWCVWYGLRSSRSESEQWVWCVNIETGSTRMQTIPAEPSPESFQ